MSGVLASAPGRGSASNAFPSLSSVREGVARIHSGCNYSQLQARVIAECGIQSVFYYVTVFGNCYLPPENTEYFSFTAKMPTGNLN